MKTLAISILVLCFAISAHAQTWEDHAANAMSNFGIGSNPTGPGTMYEQAVRAQRPNPFQYEDDLSGWDTQGLDESLHREYERSYWQSQGNYGVPHNDKPIAPCGPYYAPRAAKNCY